MACYDQLVLPVLTYGCNVWSSNTSHVDVMQRKLRIFYVFYFYIQVHLIQCYVDKLVHYQFNVIKKFSKFLYAFVEWWMVVVYHVQGIDKKKSELGCSFDWINSLRPNDAYVRQ